MRQDSRPDRVQAVECTSTLRSDRLKKEMASLSNPKQAELISHALRLRCAGDPYYRREATDRLKDSDRSQ